MARTEAQKRDAAKDARLRLFFRTSLEEYQVIEAYQEQEEDYSVLLGTTRRGLDHDHKSGLVRGVLDWRINRALGIIENAFGWEKAADVCRALAAYLECPPAILALGVYRYGLIGKAQRKRKMVYGPPVEKKNA